MTTNNNTHTTMNQINDDELRFVLRHYRRGRFDASRALKRLRAARGRRHDIRLRRVAVAAAVAAAIGVAVAAAIAGYRHYRIRQAAPAPAMPIVVADTTISSYTEADTVDVFRYDRTPINSVLQELSRHYGVELAASDTSKSVSGEIEAASADDAISVLEATLGIRITKRQRP